MNKRLLVAVVLFSCFVLVFTFNDKVVHNDLYGYGLQLDYGWAVPYWVNYFLMYEVAIFACFAICWNKWFLIFSELLVIWTTQDIVYFLWCGYFPTEQWTWMWQYIVFGTWTTGLQFFVSGFIFVGLSVVLVFHSSLLNRR